MSLNSGHIRPLTSELPALEGQKKSCGHDSTFSFDRIFLKLADNEDRRKILDEFQFMPEWTIHFSYMPLSVQQKFLRLTIKNFLFAVSRPTQKNCPYPKIFIGLLEIFFFISCFQTQVFNFFCISHKKWRECDVVHNRGATERGINRKNDIPFFNSHLKPLPFDSVCKKKKKWLPTNPHSKFWVGWQQTNYFLGMASHMLTMEKSLWTR